MSYDDGKLADRKLISIFNKYGIRGTFHINSGLFSDPERIQKDEMAKLYEGHEVACHTLTHPTIERCPLPLVAKQVLDDRKELEEVVGYPVRGLSYPNGSYTEEIKKLLPALGIAYSRIVGSNDAFGMPRDYYEWQSTCHHNHNLLKNGENFVNLFKTQYLYMMYVWGHSYEFDRDNNWDMMEEFCKLVGGKEDTWYATNIEIVDYMDAANRLQYSVDDTFAYNPSAISVWVSVAGEKYEVPAGKTVYFK
jgi:Predicted xylanase/chitin deacetylase